MASVPVNLDRKLSADILDQHGVGQEQDLFGIEVELEGRKIKTQKDSIMKYWVIHEDGSLRVQKADAQACEYVLRKPLNIDETQQALLELFSFLTTTEGVEVFDSYRTSIHVHLNFLNDTTRTIVNFLTLSIIFDELFVSQNGETRIGNNFCLRAKDAEGQVTDLISSVSNYGSVFNLAPNNRYSSVNMSSLLKFGTVEFRSLECTTNFPRVVHWIKTLQALKVAARQYENPKEIISKFSRRGPLGFMISNLGEQYGKYAAVLGAHQMLHNGMRLAQDFAFCSDWQPPKEGDARLNKEARYKMLHNNLMHQMLAQPHQWEVPPPMPNIWAEPPLQVDTIIGHFVEQVIEDDEEEIDDEDPEDDEDEDF